jgi:hypothetical protein
MNNGNIFFLPPSLILSGLLALLAVMLNYFSPGAAAVVAAIAAILFMKLLIDAMGR